MNKIKITKREIELLAFTAINGNIYENNKKKEFCDIVNTTMATTGNMITKLTKLKLLTKDKNVIVVNSKICPKFDDTVIIQTTLS